MLKKTLGVLVSLAGLALFVLAYRDPEPFVQGYFAVFGAIVVTVADLLAPFMPFGG